MLVKNSPAVLEKAKKFIYQNGRLLDRARYEYFFENGSKEAVLSSLRAYQNDDGGFGHALEPDIRCPQSQPVATEFALSVMDEIDLFDPSIVQGIVRFLKHIAVKTGGFPFALKSLNDYPHAPWFTVERDDTASMNPTGRIIGLLFKQNAYTAFYEEEWFLQSVEYVWNHIDMVNASFYHDVIQCITFLENTPDRSRAEKFLSLVDKWLSRPGTIERNPEAVGYVHKILDWAPSRDSYCSKFITEAELELHLSYLVSQQQDDGGWPISWPAVSPMGELEWRGFITVERLKTLRSYGWL
jgi:hypothetical protein